MSLGRWSGSGLRCFFFGLAFLGSSLSCSSSPGSSGSDLAPVGGGVAGQKAAKAQLVEGELELVGRDALRLAAIEQTKGLGEPHGQVAVGVAGLNQQEQEGVDGRLELTCGGGLDKLTTNLEEMVG